MISGPLVAAALAAAVGGGANAFVDRAVLLAVDARCGLLASDERAALASSTRQARGVMARQGWSEAALRQLEAEIAASANSRACSEPAIQAEADRAKTAFKAWRGAHTTQFPGSETPWVARRTPDPKGWLLWQDLPEGARFGVRMWPQGPRLTFTAPASAGAARLSARDPARYGEPTPAPLRGASRAWMANSRAANPGEVAFTFPDAAMLALGDLDPRDGAVIELTGADGAVTRRARIEVGDFAAAAAFLAAGGT